MLFLGVMTGTSCDGLDAVCVEFSSNKDAVPEWRILWSESLAYPKALREKALWIQLPGRKVKLQEFLELDRALGEWYGSSLKKLIATHDRKPHLIANHGQTVAHFPDSEVTLQLGDPTRIAEATGLSVISHFREGDMAAGGQGAPLLPFFHRELARALPEARSGIAIHNLGGISNLTYIAPDQSVLAFDTGPSNIWIDEATRLATRGKRGFDRDGALARRGEVDAKAIAKILSLPYFRKAPPKSTGRDDFPFRLLRAATRARGENLVATATAVTVESVAQAYRKFILDRGLPLSAIYCAGGGGKNSYLLECLAARLPGTRVCRLTDAGIPGLSEQILEPLGFALFGYFSLRGKPIGGPWTGASSFGPPGWITPGENWQEILNQLCE